MVRTGPFFGRESEGEFSCSSPACFPGWETGGFFFGRVSTRRFFRVDNREDCLSNQKEGGMSMSNHEDDKKRSEKAAFDG